MTSFGVLLAQDHSPAEVLDWARRFDEAGADSVWVADHLANPFDVNSLWFDGWTLLAAMAVTTSRCRIGPLVSNFVLHSPLRMARLTTTLDGISNGRLNLGLGMGGASVCRSASSVYERVDFVAGTEPTNRQELAELVTRMSELGFDECIATGWPPVGGPERSIDELLAFVSEDLPALRSS